MKLFFSYGHDKNEELVLRIKSDLEKRNHEIWIDRCQIKSGDDWRRTITSGILSSELMMAFASKYSVRNPGVCLDELMIAVSIKGAQIQTVLLESDVIPPANIGFRQYIDMSMWATKWGTDEFEEWYFDKLNDIIRVIESPETAKYAEELEFIREQLDPNLSSSKKDRLEQEYYCGREWLSKQVQDWLNDINAPRILLLEGSPGIGKSSFIAHEFIFNASVGAVFFCEWDNPEYNNIDAISRCMVFQLASKLSDYRSRVVQYLKDILKLDNQHGKLESGEEIFQSLLLRQLRSLIDGNRPTLLILIDGIDELKEKNDGGRRRNAFAELLRKDINSFPRWIRFVVTSRRDSEVMIPLQNMAFICMDESATDNARDVKQYLWHELKGAISQTEINQISAKCDGIFLYAKIVVEAIKAKKLSVEDVLAGKTGDLGFVYRNYFDRIFQTVEEYEITYYPAIAALAVSEERIPEKTFRIITGWARRNYIRTLKILSPLLSSGREYLGLYHKSLQDWLLSEDADDYVVDAFDGIIGISKACLQSYAHDMHSMNDYELKYLIPSLEKTQDSELQRVINNTKYAELLLQRAKSKAQVLCYEEAVILGEMAWRIYKNTGVCKKAARVGLFLAKITDSMVNLEESIQWCNEALAVVGQNRTLTESELPGEIWMHLAYVYFRQGKWEQSIDGYRNAYEFFAKCENIKGGQQEYKKIEALMMQANALRNATDYFESIKLFEAIEALPVFKTLINSEAVLYTNILMYHGWALHSASRYKEAGEYLEYAEKMCEVVELPLKDRAQIYYLRSIELYNMADYPAAQDYCDKSLYYVRKVYGENAVEVCSALNQLGAIAQKQNQHEKAVQLFWRSYEIRRNYYGDNNLFTTISLRNYANALMHSGNADTLNEVGTVFEKIKDIRERIAEGGEGLGWLAQSYLDLADFNRSISRYAEAEKYVLKAKYLYEKHGTIRDISTCERQIGLIKYEQKEYACAKAAFEKALVLSEKCYDTEHPYLKELKRWLEKTDTAGKIFL